MTVFPLPKSGAPLSVGVAVDLERTPNAGGHVKCWERFAEAATGFGDRVDLTVYFLSPDGTDQSVPLSSNVRLRLLPARRGTRSLGLRQSGGHTDLAGRHPLGQRLFVGHDLLHATASFALSRSAAAVARERGLPLAASVHTDLPAFARRYTGEVVFNLFGRFRPARAAVERLGLPALAARWMGRRVARVLGAADHLFHSHPGQAAWFARDYPETPASRLRRGIDRDRFDPVWRDRDWLVRTFELPGDAVILLFAGRVDETKNVRLAADVTAVLHQRELPVHLLVMGEGDQRAAVARRLGPLATLPGAVPQSVLARIYASADIYVFPSQTETFGNVVLEAKAAGMPVAVRAGTAPAQTIRAPGTDGVIVASDTAEGWADALTPLILDGAARLRMGAAARASVLQNDPDWAGVFETDLLMAWEGMTDRTVLPSEVPEAA